MTSEQSNEATPADLKALAHPLRMRILRVCLHDSVTNKQIAERLNLDPATALYHVRQLADNGFLKPEPARTGKRGALEKPYRATGKSWSLTFPRADERQSTVLAGLDAARDEILAAGPDSVITNTRAGLRLSSTDIDDLTERLQELVHDFAQRPADPDGIRVGLITMLHHLDAPDSADEDP
jgi:predicted ArsR family transcriptional regulator